MMAHPNDIMMHPNTPLNLLPIHVEADDFLCDFFGSWYGEITKSETGVFYQTTLSGQ
jgi:hypothetical protein